MMLIPEFSENKEKSVLLYFPVENNDINALYNELEKTYVCFEKMSKVIKDGRNYVVLEIKDEE